MSSKLYVIVFMVAVAAVFGAAVSILQVTSAPTLARNRQLRQQQAYIQVFGLGDVKRLSATEMAELVVRQVETGRLVNDPETGREFELITAYVDAGRRQVKGYAFAFRGLGFWAPIEGLLAVTPDLSETMGLVIVEQKETPGLGGRIEENGFTDQFRRGISIAPSPAGGKCLVIGGSQPEPGTAAAQRHVDAITGATQTGMALENILNEHIVRFRRAMSAAGY